MRRERSGLRPVHLVLVVLLLVPPGVRIGLHLRLAHLETETQAATEGATTLEATALEDVLRNRLDAAIAELDQLSDEWRLPTLVDPKESYRILAADTVPLNDPSARRSVVWAVTRSDELVPVDTAAIAGGVLVGRVVRPFDSWGVVKVQTLLDPEYRVRFCYKGINGLLQGTGREHKGHPILEVKYATSVAALSDGDPVLTEGKDGVYPPLVLIGHITSASDCGGLPVESRLVVRAAVSLDDMVRLQLPVDKGRGRVLDARAQQLREESAR